VRRPGWVILKNYYTFHIQSIGKDKALKPISFEEYQ
jgi:hypothetical protein